MFFNKLFYNIKPLIPRRLQIFVRRRIIAYKREKYRHIWPIDPAAGTPPTGWQGWPGSKKFAVVLSHDVDTRKGHDQCYQLMDIEEKLGFRSSFNFVAEKYSVSETLIEDLKNRGFEVGVHGLNHDGKLFFSRQIFDERAERINAYLKEWDSTGFTSPSMHHNLDWMHALNISHSTSTFDTDPFEPQPDAVGTIFPLWVQNNAEKMRPSQDVQFSSRGESKIPDFEREKAKLLTAPVRSPRPVPVLSRGPTGQADIQEVFRGLEVESDPREIGSAFHRASEEIDENGILSEGRKGYVELPYTLPQDFTLFILMKEQNFDIWKDKLDWIAEKGGMALFNSHPDYMNFNKQKNGNEEYAIELYTEFLEYIKNRYKDQYWHVLPKDIARFWKQNFS